MPRKILAVDIPATVLLAFGAGFLIANARLILEYVRFTRRKPTALLIWRPPQPRYYGVGLALAIILGITLIYKLIRLRQPVFGETMMFVYFGYVSPIVSRRIRRGFYRDGIWTDGGFIPYNEIGGISWREGKQAVSLVVISRLRTLARRLAVPMEHYGAARRLLRDKIGEHEIHFSGTGLDLGDHDERDEA
jgi:hypothetical protein